MGDPEMMSPEDLERRLSHIPISERAEVREFVRMEPLDQRIMLYTDARTARIESREDLREIRKLLGQLCVKLDDIGGKRDREIGPYVYTTAITIGAVIAALTGGKIPGMLGGLW